MAVAVCLIIAALVERRRRARPAQAPLSRAPRLFDASAHEPAAPVEPIAVWPSAGPVDEPVWEESSPPASHEWPREDEEAPAARFEPWDDAPDRGPDVPFASAWPVPEVVVVEPTPPSEPEPDVEPELSGWPLHEVEAEVEVEAGVEEVEASDEAEQHDDEPLAPPPAASHWFGSFAPTEPWSPPAEAEQVAAGAADTDEHDAISQAVSADQDSVIELPAAPEPQPGSDSSASSTPRRLPPARLRRFMGTGLSLLVLGLVLGAGVLVSGATADSTSDPSTVPNAVGTTVADTGLPNDTTSTPADTTTDTTAADTTATDTTSTDTTTTDTTTTDTTTTDTTTTDTTSTDPTTTTTSTDPTTTTTSTDPSTDTTTTDTTPVAPTTTTDPTPPPAAPAVPAVAPPPAVVPTTPAPASTTPATTPTSPKPTHKAKPKTPTHMSKPAKATPTTTPPASSAPSTTGPPVVTLASGADPIGSILARTTAIPAVDAALLPTPAQVRFYVQASKPLAALPSLVRIDHPLAVRLVSAGRRGHVSWTVLAAIARLESNLGAKPGLLAGRRLPTTPTGNGLAALATYLHDHGAAANPLAPARSLKALKLYFGSARKANRAIALAALYGALGPFGMQHGVRAETARLQHRVLADKRVHLTLAGRGDIRHGRVDPRVLVTLEYLANSFHKIGISDLVSGGQIFSRSGAVSAHLYGRAADVSSLRGTSVRGHQGPGTLTEQAIRKLLLLPRSLRPRQIISLMDVDGPTGNRGSFALPDHYNRIQIDY